MATYKFVVGDIVRLRCGGHKMVVSALSTDGKTVSCTWFPIIGLFSLPAGSIKPQYDADPRAYSFKHEVLELAEKD